MKKLIFILLVFACSSVAKATEQVPDYLYYNNKKLPLYTSWGHPSPLQTYYSQNNLDYPFPSWSTANYRGHVASWEIIDGKLYLNEIKVGDTVFTPQKYHVKSLNESFNQGNSVFADWFSGIISCHEKNTSYYFHINNGEVVNAQTLSKKDYKRISKITIKDTSNYALMNKYFILLFNSNYLSYYFRLYEEDEVLINNQKARFISKAGCSPLLELYSNDHMQWPYNWENLEKNGAPHCSWSIIDNKVYLTKIELYSGTGFFEIEKDSVAINDLFDKNVSNNSVLADWLSGIYFIKHGAEEDNKLFEAYKKFIPTEYSYLRVENGVIRELYTVPKDFNFKEIPEDTEPGLKRILEESKLWGFQ